MSMDDLYDTTLKVDSFTEENWSELLSSTLPNSEKILLIDILIKFNELEYEIKRLVAYEGIKTYKNEIKTLPLAQLLLNIEIIKYFDDDIVLLLQKLHVNLFLRNLIAHSIPKIIEDKYILFLSHDFVEAKKMRVEANRDGYKYRDLSRTKALINKPFELDLSNYSIMRIRDLEKYLELLEYIKPKIEKIVSKI